MPAATPFVADCAAAGTSQSGVHLATNGLAFVCHVLGGWVESCLCMELQMIHEPSRAVSWQAYWR
jgi:hypothetical protein